MLGQRGGRGRPTALNPLESVLSFGKMGFVRIIDTSGMAHLCTLRHCAIALALVAAMIAPHAVLAQQWQTEMGKTPSAPPSPPASIPELRPTSPILLPPNTTVVPRTTQDGRAGAGAAGLSLVALLTQDGQGIDQGLVWRVYAGKLGPDGKPRLISMHREASPQLRLEPGDYLINVAFGRANLTRKITVSSESQQERFVLNAGGLRLTPAVARGEPVNERAVVYDIYSDERDQYGQRTRVMGAARPGIVLRLNAGIYNVVGTYGDGNAVARADVTVEAGKLTEATIVHAAARVTFKLVAQSGGDAIAETQWTIANAQGETVKESVGALPTHIFAPGTYVVSARNGGDVFQRRFALQAGDVVQVEVVRR
jgi:hypothetical protein